MVLIKSLPREPPINPSKIRKPQYFLQSHLLERVYNTFTYVPIDILFKSLHPNNPVSHPLKH